MDFPPDRSYKGKNGRGKWFRCWFDATVQRYDDLWIHRETPPMFCRAWFEPLEGKKKPRAEDLIDLYWLELGAGFLNVDNKLQPFVEKEVSKWLARNFKVG